MFNEVKSLPVDLAVFAAAVTILNHSKNRNKIKKNKFNNDWINLTKNIDILEYVSKNNGDKIVAGFSAETENVIKIQLINLKTKIAI